MTDHASEKEKNYWRRNRFYSRKNVLRQLISVESLLFLH